MKYNSIDELFRNNQAWVADKLAMAITHLPFASRV
jgi:hypothetical protein